MTSDSEQNILETEDVPDFGSLSFILANIRNING